MKGIPVVAKRPNHKSKTVGLQNTSLASESKKYSFSSEPSNVSGYFCSVCGHVSKRWPLTLNQIRSSAGDAEPSPIAVAAASSHADADPRATWTADGSRVFAIGTQPIADARAKGNHDATEAMSQETEAEFYPSVNCEYSCRLTFTAGNSTNNRLCDVRRERTSDGVGFCKITIYDL